jgi:uncharacterized protein (TIGR04255 family)
MADLPKFAAPPVVEMVLGVQFDPLPKITSAHAGWFWKERLGNEWTQVLQAHVLEDQFEKFGDERELMTSPFRVAPAPTVLRMQFVTPDEERMIQIQSSRFVCNWRKMVGDYPSFEALLPEFEHLLGMFRDFVETAGLGEVKPNQWEIIYVNQVFQGELWQSPRDWSGIATSFAPPVSSEDLGYESFEAKWRFVIGQNAGRVHIETRHGQKLTEDRKELIVIQLTARGREVSQPARLHQNTQERLGRCGSALDRPEDHKDREIRPAATRRWRGTAPD